MFPKLRQRSSLPSGQSAIKQQREAVDEQSLHIFYDFQVYSGFDEEKDADPINRARDSNMKSSKMGKQVQQRRRGMIDVDRIYQLIEAFKRYDIEHSQPENKRRTTLAQIGRELQMKYQIVRKKHVLFKKHGADFFYSQYNLDYNHKIKLATRLVSSVIAKGSHIKYSKDISAYIEERYGILYSIRTINKIRKQLRQKPTSNEQADFSSMCCKELGYLLNGILSKSYDIYYTWRVAQHEAYKFGSRIFFASRQRCIIRQMGVQDVITTVIKQICLEVNEGLENSNYCVIAYLEDIKGDAKDLLKQKINENNFLIEMALVKAKVILLGQQKSKSWVLPNWIEDCYRRQKEKEVQIFDFAEDETEEIKEIICKGIQYFESNLLKSKK